jgi:capsular exopolysaccharide synthesis family protein
MLLVTAKRHLGFLAGGATVHSGLLSRLRSCAGSQQCRISWTLQPVQQIFFYSCLSDGWRSPYLSDGIGTQMVNSGWSLRDLARMVVSNAEMRDAYVALLGGLRINGTHGSGSVLVTSTQPTEGKTTIASCLALTASLAGQSVLLVDGDLRRRQLASAAGIVDGIGLTEILDGQAGAIEVMHSVQLFEAAWPAGPISIMAAGRKSSTILPAVNWSRARSTFKEITQGFDVVVIDSPPILAANDALLLAGIVDGILFVIDTEGTDREEVRRAREQLDLIGTPVLGAVLNRFDPKIHGKSSQPYRGYYLAAQP